MRDPFFKQHQKRLITIIQEEKNLLLKDLCARLPYDLNIQYKQKTFVPYGEYTIDVKIEIDDMLHYRLKHLDFKPYLRSMSSMTAEEKKKYDKLRMSFYKNAKDASLVLVDWLNEHHFDHRGLIEKNLALEAPEGMYVI